MKKFYKWTEQKRDDYCYLYQHFVGMYGARLFLDPELRNYLFVYIGVWGIPEPLPLILFISKLSSASTLTI